MWHYREGAKKHAVDAETTGPELTRIREQYGALRRSYVVDESTDPQAPCHAEFDWNDKTAAHQHRLEQAGQLIRDVIFIEPPKTKRAKALTVRFMSVPEGRGAHRYEPSNVIVESTEDYRRVLAKLTNQLAGVERTFDALTQAASKSSVPEVKDSARAVKKLMGDLREIVDSIPQE